MASGTLGAAGAAAAPALAPSIKTDPATLIQYAKLVKLAEDVPPGQTIYTPGKLIPVSYDAINITYTAVATFYGNDLATEANPARAAQIVSFGFVCQDPAGNVVVAIRGTEGIFEWLQDARFLAIPCPILPGAGFSEDGFTAVYESLRQTADPHSARLAGILPSLPYPNPVKSLTICGHSLGGALATLFALDVAAHQTANAAAAAAAGAGAIGAGASAGAASTLMPAPTVYTYASPHTGDASFVDTYNQLVPKTCRVTNRLDIVPKVPLPPPYQHVAQPFELNPKLEVKTDVLCEHHLTSYMFLLSKLGGGTVLPLDAGCGGLVPKL